MNFGLIFFSANPQRWEIPAARQCATLLDQVELAEQLATTMFGPRDTRRRICTIPRNSHCWALWRRALNVSAWVPISLRYPCTIRCKLPNRRRRWTHYPMGVLTWVWVSATLYEISIRTKCHGANAVRVWRKAWPSLRVFGRSRTSHLTVSTTVFRRRRYSHVPYRFVRRYGWRQPWNEHLTARRAIKRISPAPAPASNTTSNAYSTTDTIRGNSTKASWSFITWQTR